MADLSFAYANSRVNAMKSKLFDRDRMRELMDVGTLDEFIELLEETQYKPFFVDASTRYRGLELVKHALDANFVATLARLSQILPDQSQQVYSVLVRRWEINNIKKIIASKAIGKPVSMQDLLPAAGESTALFEKLIAAKDLPEVLEVLRRTPYGAAIQGKQADFLKRQGDFRVFLEVLDLHYFNSLLQCLDAARDEFTAGFIRDQLDFANALVVLRMMKSGVTPEKILRHVAVAKGARKLVEQMLAQPDAAKALEVFVRRKRMSLDAAATAEVAKGRDASLSLVEVEVEKALLAKARRTLSRGVLSLGVVVSFLHLKQEEVHSLRKIAYATQFEIKDDLRGRVLSAA